LHPGIDDPGEFLDFREEYVFAIDGNPRGETTIEALGLNREPLAKVRRDHLVLFKVLVDFRNWVVGQLSHQTDPDHDLVKKLSELNAQVMNYVRESAQYTAMARAAERSAGLPRK
jgi:hypothetical protein